MSTSVASVPAATTERMSKALSLTERFARAAIADPSILDDIPEGAALVLIPDDDPEQAEAEIAAGLLILRRGTNVYFRRVRAGELPE